MEFIWFLAGVLVTLLIFSLGMYLIRRAEEEARWASTLEYEGEEFWSR